MPKRALLSWLSWILLANPLAAVLPPASPELGDKAYRHPALHLPDRYGRVDATTPPAVQRLAALGLPPERAFLDQRSGRWGTLLPATPLIPGQGVGNELTWQSLTLKHLTTGPPRDEAGLRHAAWKALVDYLRRHREALRIEPSELTDPGHVTLHEDGRLIQIHAPRVVDGVPVRESFLTAVLRHGNLILFGTRNWSDVSTSSRPTLEAESARDVVRQHLGTVRAGGWRKPYRVFVPLADGGGLDYRLAWVLRPVFDHAPGEAWEALVDAHDGELLAFEDRVLHASPREVEGGIFPVSNDGTDAAGVEQPRFPMPFADLENGGEVTFTDSEGNLLELVDGTVTTTLDGRFVRINDGCGPIEESTSGQFLDLGTSAGTDCDVPPGASPGNTHAARSGFYELNRIKELARGHLPANAWLQEQLTTNVNIPLNCGATWNGSEINVFTSGAGCANTGELAGVFDHEWGHGMDDNDANPNISNPAEGVADVYAYLRLDESCIGRGFLPGNCGGYGDPCTDCTGVRDIDFARRASGQPHDVAWIDANCPSGSGPCGGVLHCEGAVTSEALFDLVNRDLPALGFDHNTSLQIGTRLHYLGAGLVGNWFQCSIPFGGCNGDGGYLNTLAADDDNGDLGDGTPHMPAIFAAFDRHGIACDTPAVIDAACDFEPAAAPVVAALPRDREIVLVWQEVVGAGKFQIYRTDGVRACDFGKVLAGETAAGITEFTDTGLKNGHEYHYTVIPIGSDDACFGPASDCLTVAPVAGPHAICEPLTVELLSGPGDGDICLDNGEQARFLFEVQNIGSGALSDVAVSVAVVSPPELVLLSDAPRPSTFPNLPEGGRATSRIDFQAFGLAAGDTVTLRIDTTATEIAPAIRSHVLRLPVRAECDFDFSASRTFDFETDLESWSVSRGTFARETDLGGGDGSATAVASSAFLADQCDEIRSPGLILTPASSLTAWTNFDIEPMSGDAWYDRANLAVLSGEERTVITPDGGRLYDVDAASPGNFSGCNAGEAGWAGSQPTWAASTWSAAALGTAAVPGEVIHLGALYSTDGAQSERGFSLDQVTVTDVEVEGPDTQPDAPAGPLGRIFSDGFESGDTSIWSGSTP